MDPVDPVDTVVEFIQQIADTLRSKQESAEQPQLTIEDAIAAYLTRHANVLRKEFTEGRTVACVYGVVKGYSDEANVSRVAELILEKARELKYIDSSLEMEYTVKATISGWDIKFSWEKHMAKFLNLTDNETITAPPVANLD